MKTVDKGPSKMTTTCKNKFNSPDVLGMQLGILHREKVKNPVVLNHVSEPTDGKRPRSILS